MDRIRGFDGLRALALLLVFLQHYTTLGRDYETGGYGVWLFFALSGFLIVRILADERRAVEAGAKGVAEALKRFFWRRTLRIMPIYYGVLALFSLLAAIGAAGDFRAQDAPWYFAYLSNVYFGFVEGRWIGRFGHFWSLAVEEQFYLLAAPALLLAPARWARGICAGVVLAALACDLGLRSAGAGSMVLYNHPLTNFGALALGGWMGLALPRRPGAGRGSWSAAACLLAIPAFIYGFHQLGAFPEGVATLIAMAPFWCASLLSALLLAALHRNQQSRLAAVLEWRPLAGLGRVSYGFYLYHNLLPRRLVAGIAEGLGPDWLARDLAQALAAFVLSLGLALLSWRLVERPLLALKDRPLRLGPPRPALAPAEG
jgi:peptidoglycan/LPS O-acetylase OafA/YrhL